MTYALHKFSPRSNSSSLSVASQAKGNTESANSSILITPTVGPLALQTLWGHCSLTGHWESVGATPGGPSSRPLRVRNKRRLRWPQTPRATKNTRGHSQPRPTHLAYQEQLPRTTLQSLVCRVAESEWESAGERGFSTRSLSGSLVRGEHHVDIEWCFCSGMQGRGIP